MSIYRHHIAARAKSVVVALADDNFQDVGKRAGVFIAETLQRGNAEPTSQFCPRARIGPIVTIPLPGIVRCSPILLQCAPLVESISPFGTAIYHNVADDNRPVQTAELHHHNHSRLLPINLKLNVRYGYRQGCGLPDGPRCAYEVSHE